MSGKAVGWAYDQNVGSPTLKSVLVAIADNADHVGRCWPSQTLIARKTELSLRTVHSAIGKLQEFGMFVRETRRNKDGSRTSDLYILAIGSTKIRGRKLNNLDAIDDEPTCNSPQNLRAGGAHRLDDLHATDDKPTCNSLQSLRATVAYKPSIEPSKKNQTNDQFDEFWKIYPQKVAKKPARKAFANALKLIDFDTLLSKTKAFARTQTSADPKFVPHAATWLNQQRWEDETLNAETVPNPRSFSESDWRIRLRIFKDTDDWDPEWGPRPGTSNCLVPSELLVDAASENANSVSPSRTDHPQKASRGP